MATKSRQNVDIATRLATAIETVAAGTQKQVAERLGISRSYVSEMMSGRARLGQDVLVALSHEGINLNWLLTGTGTMIEARDVREGVLPTWGETTLLIPHYGVALGAGDEKVPRRETPKDWSPYRRDEVIRMASSTEHLVELEVDGESMTPTFYPGERVLVDMNKDRALKDGIWAIRIGDGLLIKRLAVDPDGTINVLSDNAAYPPKIIRSGNADGFAVVGKVLMVAKRL